jgi:integrase
MLRHLFAKEMSQVTDVKTLQSLMRHARADMSLYYSWSNDDELKEAVNKRNLS